MHQRRLLPCLAILTPGALWLFAIVGLHGQAPAPRQDLNHPQGTNAGIFAFTGNCASCHDAGTGGAPDRYTLNRRTPEEVLAAMRTGAHAEYAKVLTEFQKRVVAVYVGGRPLGASDTGDASKMKNACSGAPAFEPFRGSEWNGWGVDQANTRFQPTPGLSAAD